MNKTPTIKLEWSWFINGTPESIWNLVTDTRQINAASGVFEKFSYEYTADSDGIVLKNVKENAKGNNKPFTEFPFEWIRPHYYEVTRYFKTSPIYNLYYRVDLYPEKDHRTRLVYTLEILPRNSFSRLILQPFLRYVTYKGLNKAFQKINEILAENKKHTHFFSSRDPKPVVHIEELNQRQEKISGDFPYAYRDSLKDAILNWTDNELISIRPYEFADYYGLNRRTALKYLILCTEAGILSLEWRPYCPSCHGSGELTYHTLQDVSSQAYCPACHISYEALFDRGIEATFEVQKAIRQVSGEVYCTGGPEKTDHIWLQYILKPNEEKNFRLKLPSGVYSINKTQFEILAHLDVNSTGNQEKVILNTEETADPEKDRINLINDAEIVIHNNSDKRQLIQLHQITDLSTIATAAEVTTLSQFRKYFNKSLIRPGERFGVDNIVILFSDIRNSTDLYYTLGDANAIGLIQDHFDILRRGVHDHYGSVIKTIGDAVMAVFYKPDDALKASEQIIRNIKYFNKINSHSLNIKLGLHTGSAFALTYDQKIDYFGTTVNFCSRLEKLTGDADLVITDYFKNQDEVSDYLQNSGVKTESFREPIKGIYKEPTLLHRITF